MLKKKAYVEVEKELENIKKAREKFEDRMKEVEDIKSVLVQVGEDMNRIVGLIDESQNEMKVHRKIILQSEERIAKLEKKDEPDYDVMYK